MRRSSLTKTSPVLPTHTRGQADDAFAGMALASLGFFTLGALSGGTTVLVAAACCAGALVNHWKDVVGAPEADGGKERQRIRSRHRTAKRHSHGYPPGPSLIGDAKKSV